MKQLSLVALAIMVLIFSSCEKVVGDGPVVTQNRTTNNFSRISMSGSGTLFYRQDNAYKVEIQAQQNILDVIETNVVNNELVIKLKNNVRIRSHEDIVVTISAPAVTGLTLSGSGNIYTTGSFTPYNIDLNVSGSGNIMVQNLVTNNIDAG
ncbi:MAG TPA: DUF2807 domain-containing protein, partial [Chitinophagaceae bacterium]|nr:DUF2807 domain-containing protein [Chitinophagaceae bacterium]